MAMKLISNKVLREFAAIHVDAQQPLQDFRRLIERGIFANFAQLKATFASVDKVGDRCVFNIGGNKGAMPCKPGMVSVKAFLTHKEYDHAAWQ